MVDTVQPYVRETRRDADGSFLILLSIGFFCFLWAFLLIFTTTQVSNEVRFHKCQVQVKSQAVRCAPSTKGARNATEHCFSSGAPAPSTVVSTLLPFSQVRVPSFVASLSLVRRAGSASAAGHFPRRLPRLSPPRAQAWPNLFIVDVVLAIWSLSIIWYAPSARSAAIRSWALLNSAAARLNALSLICGGGAREWGEPRMGRMGRVARTQHTKVDERRASQRPAHRPVKMG